MPDPMQTYYRQWGRICGELFDSVVERRPLRKLADVVAEPKKLRRALPPGECKFCDAHRHESMMPYHDASPRCESGRHPHCTCDTCF